MEREIMGEKWNPKGEREAGRERERKRKRKQVRPTDNLGCHFSGITYNFLSSFFPVSIFYVYRCFAYM